MNFRIIGCHLDVEWANELILFSMNFRSHFCMCHRQIFVAKMKNYENYHSIQLLIENTNRSIIL